MARRPFSVHDVVKEMRDRANGFAGNFIFMLSDVLHDVFDGVPYRRPVIKYDNALKQLVLSCLNGRSFITRTNPSGYVVFDATRRGHSAVKPKPVANISVVGGNAIKYKPTTVKQFSPKSGDLDVIESYVNTKLAKGERPTVKMAQSAAKRGSNGYKSVPGKDIRNYFIGKGYNVAPGSNRTAEIWK